MAECMVRWRPSWLMAECMAELLGRHAQQTQIDYRGGFPQRGGPDQVSPPADLPLAGAEAMGLNDQKQGSGVTTKGMLGALAGIQAGTGFEAPGFGPGPAKAPALSRLIPAGCPAGSGGALPAASSSVLPQLLGCGVEVPPPATPP